MSDNKTPEQPEIKTTEFRADWSNLSQQQEFKTRFLIQYISEGFRLTNANNRGKGGGRKYDDKDDFWGWLEQPDTKYPFCFSKLCESLDLDPEKLKNLLQFHKRRLLKKK